MQNPLYKIASFLSYAEAQGWATQSFLPCWTTEKDYASILGRLRTFYNGSRPISDKKILNSVEQIDLKSFVHDAYIDKKLYDIIYNWLQQSKYFNFNGIDKLPYFDQTFGVTQSIDSFFSMHQKQKIGITKNEYWYVSEVASNNDVYTADLNSIIPNSSIIVSTPHSYLGEDMNNFICKAKSLNCYVAVDLTYATICINQIKLDFDYIDECWISLNKTWPIATLRTGFRFSKNKISDGISWISSMPLTNRVGGGVMLELLQNYDVNYTIEKYYETVLEICSKCDLEPTNILNVAKSSNYKNYFSWTASKYNQNHGERINLSSVIENYDLLKEKNLI